MFPIMEEREMQALKKKLGIVLLEKIILEKCKGN